MRRCRKLEPKRNPDIDLCNVFYTFHTCTSQRSINRVCMWMSPVRPAFPLGRLLQWEWHCPALPCVEMLHLTWETLQHCCSSKTNIPIEKGPHFLSSEHKLRRKLLEISSKVWDSLWFQCPIVSMTMATRVFYQHLMMVQWNLLSN